MLVTLFLVCAVALGEATVLLLLTGHRVRFASRLVGVVLGAALILAAGEAAGWLWQLPADYVEVAELCLLAAVVVIALARRRWNPIGQVFFAMFLAAITTYLVAALAYTFASGLGPLGVLAASLLFVFELIALVLACTFAFESCDVICRTRWDRPITPPDPAYQPKVSLQIAAHDEPPDMLIETIKSAEAIDYPNFEVVVIDNNTKDPEVWQPVADYCRDRPHVRYVHVDPWPGYKSGALNLALTEHTAPDAEIVGVIDADYLVDPDYLQSVVGYFVDPNVAFVQTPQDYRDYEGDAYLTACYDAYKYFFTTSMPSRNERNSIIFAGTMGLLRRHVLEGLGGWDEWCITEDAETSLRMLQAGWAGVFVPKAFGRGIMPLTFASLKGQRFRWCFGGMQILRRHWREMLPWRRDPDNHLSTGQRLDYLFSGLQWLNDLVNLAFTIVLLAMGAMFLTGGTVRLRPLEGAVILLPAAIIASGLLRALWALRQRTGITLRRGLLAFANWLSLSWTVALACVQGLVRSEGVFMRTPKTGDDNKLWTALWNARAETLIALGVWATGIAVALSGRANAFVCVLFAWQGSVYASAPFMSWLNQRAALSPELERRKRVQSLRERAAVVLQPRYAGTIVAALGAIVLAIVVVSGGGQQSTRGSNPFTIPKAPPGDEGGPLQHAVSGSDESASTSSSSDSTSSSSDTTTSSGSDTTSADNTSTTTASSDTTTTTTTTETTTSTSSTTSSP